MARKDDERDYYFKSGPTDYYDGTDSGADDSFLSGADREAVQGYKSQWEEGRKSGDQALMDAAHKAAEGVRSKYNYSGGANGGAYNPFGGSAAAGGVSGGGFSYEDAPAYQSKYQEQIDALTKGILGREDFSYDAEKDPLYQQYRESYTRDGQRAMQDTLGQVSARTGGLASSYAGTAAQQSYNDRMDALDDKIPELRQLAYSMYMDEGDRQRSDLSMLMGLDQSAYGKFQDRLGQYNTDRGFDYGAYADGRNWDYQAGRDAVNDRRYDREYVDRRGDVAYQREQDKALNLAAAGSFSALSRLWGMDETQTQALVDEYARQRDLTEEQSARDLADWHAQYGDFSRLKEQGVDTSYLSWQQKQSMKPTGGGGGKGASGYQDYEGLYAAAWVSPNPQNFISSNYKKYGFTSSAGLAAGFKDWKVSEAENGQKLYDKGDFETLMAYSQKMQGAGRSTEYMYDALKKQGYTDAVIDQVFAALGL